MKRRTIMLAMVTGLMVNVASAGDKPNVLFIAVDDLKPILGCYGDETVQTPHIDRLATQGTVFLNAHCQQAVCGPSRASLLTGLRPDRTRVWDLKTKIRDMDPDVVTLPQHFRQHGYTALGTGKIFDFRSVEGHLRDDPESWSRPYTVFPQNPDSAFGCVDPEFVARVRELKADGVSGNRIKEALGGTPPVEIDQDVPDSAYDDGRIADTGIRLLEELSRAEDPFFLAVGFKKPHLPFVAPKRYADLYPRSRFVPHPVTERPEGSPAYHWQPGWELRNGSYSDVPLLREGGAIPDSMQVTLMHGYYACVSYIDAQIGRLLGALEASGEADNTIVVLWGDHGWHLGDHGMWCKHTNYEQSTRVPMVIADLRTPKGQKSHGPVEFVDIYPTLCELAGLPTPEVLEGESLAPVLADPSVSVKQVAVSQFPRHTGNGEAMGYAYRDTRYRYIEWIQMDYRAGERDGKRVAHEFYDYEADPQELRNRVDDPAYADHVARLQSIAAAHRGTDPAGARSASPVAPAASATPPTLTRPNVVFFIADDMLPKHFNCLPQGKGRNLTPNIDRLAREGTVMLEQHVASPICTPSRYNVLSGRYASRARNAYFLERTAREGQTVVEFNTHIVQTDVTLPALMKKAGYTTGMVGKNHVVEVQGLAGFPDFDAGARDPANAAKLTSNHERVCQAIRGIGFDYVDRVYHNNPNFLGLHEVAVQNLDWITEGGVRFIEQQRDQPFFLYFATTVPHGPTQAERSWNADPMLSATGYLDRAPEVQPARATIPRRLMDAGFPVNDDTANMLWLDDAVGALLGKLEATGRLDNTVFFFFSDHGQMSKGTLYQGGVHNPSLVWKKGGFPVGAECDALVHIVDFAPTILDLAGFNHADAAFDGESFLPYLNGKEQKDGRVLYFELGYARGVRKGNWKYMAIRYPQAVEQMTLDERKRVLDQWNAERRRKHMPIVTEDPSRPFSHLTPIPGGGDAERHSTGSFPAYFARDQLYDLSHDPREQKNLAADPEYRQKLEEMQRELENVLETLPGAFTVDPVRLGAGNRLRIRREDAV